MKNYSNNNRKQLKLFLLLSIFVFSFFILIFFALIVRAATAGPNNPATGADDSSAGTIIWLNPTRIVSSNNSYATASLDDNQISHYLKATDFSFAIPSGAVINGITAEIEKKSSNASRIQDYRVRIIKGGVIGATDKANKNWWGTSDAYITYGSSSDLWGESWTYSDINSANFGVAISAYKNTTSGGGVTASIDHIRITVTYTANIAPNAPALVSPASGLTINDNTPTLSANYSDPDAGDTGTTNYRVATSAPNCLAGTVVVSGISSETPNNNENTTWTPGSSIGTDAIYYWCAQNNDGVAQSAWTSMGNFILDTTAPTVSSVAVQTGLTVDVTFSEAMGNGVTTASNYTLSGTGQGTFANNPDTVVLVSGNTYVLTWTSGTMIDGGDITITVANAQDLVGNTIGTPNSGTHIGGGVSLPAMFVIIDPADGTVDAPIAVTVQAQRADNSVDASYQNDVTLNASGSATGDGLVDIVNGIGTLDIYDTAVETVSLSLTDSQGTGLNVDSTQQVIFAGGAISQFVLDDPGSLSVGSRISYTVTRKDQYNNLTTSGVNTVYLYSSSSGANKKFYSAASEGEVITSIDIADGNSSAQFWYYDETSGNYTITASDNSSFPDGNTNVNDAVDSITVTAGPVSKFSLNNPGDVYVRTMLGYTVTRKDQYNNLVNSGSTTVYLFSSSASGLFYSADSGGSVITSIDITDTNSNANFWYYDETSGNYTITASDNSSFPDGAAGIADAEDSVAISNVPIIATRFVIIDPADGTVDAPITVTVQAQDNLGNIDTNIQSDVTLNASGSATGDGLVDIVNGIGTLDIYDTAVETVSLSLTDSQGTGLNVDSTQDATFSVGNVNQFSLDNPGDMSAGTRIKYTVARKDQFGNLVSAGLTTVYLYGLPEEITKKFYDSESAGSVITFVNIPDGNSSAQFWYYDEQAGASSVVVSDNAAAPDGEMGIADVSDSVAVSAGPVAKFILDDPGDMAANTRLGYTVSRQDQFGNSVTAGVTLVYLYTSSTGTNVRFYDSATAGLSVTSVPIDDTKLSANFWYYDETPGTWIITISDSTPAANGSAGVADDADSVIVIANPIVATRFVISDPGPSQINAPVSVTVKAEDANGNVDTTYQNDVTLVASGSATGAGLINIINGAGALSINDTVAETVNLSLSDTETTGLDVSSAAQIIFSALPPVFTASSGVGYTPPVGGVIFSGRAYPEAVLSIAAIKDTENIIKQAAVSYADGSFKITFTGLSALARAFALLVQDKDGRTAQSKVYDLNSLNADSVLEVKNIIVSPTIGFSRPTITSGDFLAVVGYAYPTSKLSIEVDGQPINANVVAGTDGAYKYLYNTASLDLGSHTIRARQTISGGVQSEFSPQKVFFTTNLTVPKTDFNSDGKLNISDWSIFLSRWFSTDPAIRLLNDLNGDGKLDATDFSIFIRTIRI